MAKNKYAVALGKRRWKGKTKDEIRAHMSMMGRKSAQTKEKKSLDTATASD